MTALLNLMLYRLQTRPSLNLPRRRLPQRIKTSNQPRNQLLQTQSSTEVYPLKCIPQQVLQGHPHHPVAVPLLPAESSAETSQFFQTLTTLMNIAVMMIFGTTLVRSLRINFSPPDQWRLYRELCPTPGLVFSRLTSFPVVQNVLGLLAIA
jgi:hypothetical protein